eukprot:TRINITY_DN61899_c0_g1_i1.p1 TRINITY_DN61899_c0_g1~~TRINITY_DN61899_c0_g1_i1.p1  ORF type:complete len:416 (-),score=19.86 TRINITY_DN61899_c0_g1_i1:267-1514(-)
MTVKLTAKPGCLVNVCIMQLVLPAVTIAALPAFASPSEHAWVTKLTRTAGLPPEGFSVQWVEHIQLVHIIKELQSCTHAEGKGNPAWGVVEPVFINQPRHDQRTELEQDEFALLGTSFVPSSALFDSHLWTRHLAAEGLSYMTWTDFSTAALHHSEMSTANIDLLYMSDYKASVPCPDPEHPHEASFNGIDFSVREVRCIEEPPLEFSRTVIRELCSMRPLPASIGLEFRMPGGRMMHSTMTWDTYRQLRTPFHFSREVGQLARAFRDAYLHQPYLAVHWRRGLQHYNAQAPPAVLADIIAKGLTRCKCNTVFLMTNSGSDLDIQDVRDMLHGRHVVRFEPRAGWKHALQHLAVEMSIASLAAYFIPFRSSLVSRMIAEHRILIHSSSTSTILDELGLARAEQIFWWKHNGQGEL